MNRTVLLTLLIATLLVSPAFAAGQPPGAGHQADAVLGARDTEGVVTAIDVAEQWIAGQTDADIAASLSVQKGFDRQSALKRGTTDEMILWNLIGNAGDTPRMTDASKSVEHRSAADRHLREMRYDLAAQEYTKAIIFSGKSGEMYLLRANAYRQYLSNVLIPAMQRNAEPANRGRYDKSKRLVCRALYSDYESAKRANEQKIEDIRARMNAIQGRMSAMVTEGETTYVVDPYYKKSAQNTHNMLEMRRLNRALRAANQPGVNLDANKALSECKTLCEAESLPNR